MANSPCLWLTRPQADSLSLAEQLAGYGVPSIVSPIIDIKYINNNELFKNIHVNYQAILITSRHAIPALAHLPKKFQLLRIFCVGDVTASHLRTEGWQKITHAPDILTLIPHIDALERPARLLYLAGEQTHVDLPALLGPRGIKVDQRVVYSSEPIADLSTELCIALSESWVTGAVFYSTRSAMLSGRLLADQGFTAATLRMEAYCLSPAVAEAAGIFGWKALHASASPTHQALIDLIVSRNANPV